MRSNKGRTVKSVLLTMRALVPKHFQHRMPETIFEVTEQDDDEPERGIARHRVKKRLDVLRESTALGRVEA